MNFTLTLKVRLNVLALKGYAVLNFLSAPIIKVFVCFSKICGKFRLFARIFGKTVFFNLDRDKEDENSVSRYADNEYRPTVDIKSVYVSVSVGKDSDAMITALAYAFVQRIVFAGMKYFTDTQEVETAYKGRAVNANEANIDVVISVNVSLALAVKELCSFIVGKIKADIKNKALSQNKKIIKEKNINDNGTKKQIAGAYA